MDYDGFAKGLSKDEQAVLDHVSGLTRVLPEPTDSACDDREIVGELVAMRSQLGAMAIHPPEMRLSFDDILKAADQTPQPPTDNHIIYWLTGRWGIGLVTAASVAMAFITGLIVTSDQFEGPPGGSAFGSPSGIEFKEAKQVEQFPIRKTPVSEDPVTGDASAEVLPPIGDSPVDPGLYGAIIRQGSIHLRDDDPAKIQQLVTELVTSSGGLVTSLTRQGRSGEMAGQVTVELAVAVPAAKYRDFKARVAGFGEVLSESESTEDVASDQVDLKSRLAEAEDYLGRLDKLIETPNDLSSLQNLERERRQTRLEIERYRRALNSIENRVTLSRLDINISASAPAITEPEPEQGEFTKAWNDGVEGLTSVSAFLLKAGLAGSPFLAIGALAYIGLRRKRKKLEQRDAA